jgi:hypothetical protein
MVSELAAWFRDAEVRGRFDVLPGDSTSQLCHRLAAEEYIQTGTVNGADHAESGFHATLYGEPQEAPQQASTTIDVERVSSPGDARHLLRFLPMVFGRARWAGRSGA